MDLPTVMMLCFFSCLYFKSTNATVTYCYFFLTREAQSAAIMIQGGRDLHVLRTLVLSTLPVRMIR